MRWDIALLAVGVLAAAGCASNSAETAKSNTASSYVTDAPASPTAAPTNDREAIEQAIRQHLSANTSLNMAAMEMTLGPVSIHGSSAQAAAEFRLKSGGPAMQMSYSLERHATGWVVTKGEPAGGQFVHPPMDKSHTPAAGSAGGSAPSDVIRFMKTLPSPKPDPGARR